MIANNIPPNGTTKQGIITDLEFREFFDGTTFAVARLPVSIPAGQLPWGLFRLGSSMNTTTVWLRFQFALTPANAPSTSGNAYCIDRSVYDVTRQWNIASLHQVAFFPDIQTTGALRA